MSGITSESTPIEQKWRLNYKSSSNAEIKRIDTPKSAQNERYTNRAAVYTSLDSQTVMRAKENLEATEETKENFVDFAKDDLRLNTYLNTEECTSLLPSPTAIKRKKNKLPPLQISGRKKSRDLRENNDVVQDLNQKRETFESIRQDNSKNTLGSKDFGGNVNVDEIKENQESEKSNTESNNDSSENREKMDEILAVETKEDAMRRKSGLRIPIINVEDFDTNNKKRRASKAQMSRQSSKKKTFFKGLFKSLTNKIVPEKDADALNDGTAQGTIFKNADETYSFGVLSKISQAVKRFKSFVRFKKIESLEQNQLSIINDWCWYGARKHEEELLESEMNMISFHQKIIIRIVALANLMMKKFLWLSVCIDYLSGLGEKVKVFNPKSRFKMTWDLINMIIIFWNFLNISTALCFGEAIENVFLMGKVSNARKLYYFFILASFLDMVIDNLFTLNTSFYEMGALVNNRKRIFRNYLRKNLLIDLIAEVPFFVQLINYDSNVSSFSQRYLNCLFFLKYYNLKGAFKVLEEFLALDDKYEASFHLFKLFLKIFFVAHILACLWHMVAYFKSDPEAKNWISYKCIDKEGEWTERYIYAIYFALTTMSTVGYGDIIPQSQEEVAIAMLSMFVGSGMFGYALNNIGELLKRMNYKEDQLKKEIRSLDRFMKSKNIDYELQSRARKYLEYVWNEEKQNQQNEEEILGRLSHTLREEVFLQSHGKILKQYPILFKNFSEKTMRQLIHLIHPVRFSPEELIFEEGEQFLDGFLYMIAQGEIELSLAPQRRDERNCTVKILKAGDSFGEISFFTDLPQDVTAVSLNYSTIYRLKKSDFLSVIRENSEDWESFCMVRDKYILYEDMLELHMKCWSCSDNHPFRKCPALRYSPIRYKIIIEHQKKIQNSKFERRKLTRPRRNFHFHALTGKDIVSNKCLPFAKVSKASRNEVDEEENGERKPEISKLEPDPKTSLELRVENFAKKKESFVQEGSKANVDEFPIIKSPDVNVMKPPEQNLRRRNSTRKPTFMLDASQKAFPPIGIRRPSIKAETIVKEKTEANPSMVANPVNSDLEVKEDSANINSTLPDNRDEIFMMNFDQTKNLTKKKKKNPNVLTKKSKKIANALKMINRKRPEGGSQIPIKMMNTPRNSGYGQKFYFQSE